MAKANITEAWLARVAADEQSDKPAALPAGSEREKYWDEKLPGFGVVIGKRFATFMVQHRVNGKQMMRKIGRYGRPGAGDEHADIWTVARARKEAMRLLGSMEQGIAPRELHHQQPTLRDAFDAHVERLEKKKRSAATIATFKKSTSYVEAWLDRPIAELTGAVMIELHERIKRDAKPRANARNERGAPLANRVIVNVGTAWTTLNKKLEGKLGNWNPARAVEKDSLEPKRVVVLDLPKWKASVETMRNPIQRDGLEFALFTGLRSEDVRSIRFEHVDVELKTLELPDPKGGVNRAFKIPLPDTCMEIIARRERDNAENLGRDDGDGGWVFPAVDSDGEVGPIGDLRQQVHVTITDGDEQVTRHSRLPAEDVHALRRTYETVGHECGVSEIDLHVLTNHAFASHNVNATYIVQHMTHLAACQRRIETALKAKLEPSPTPAAKKQPKPSPTATRNRALHSVP